MRPTRRRNLKLVEGVVVDAAGVRETAVWFNQAYLAKLDPGTELLLHGTRELSGGFRVQRTRSAAPASTRSGSFPSTGPARTFPRTASAALVEGAMPLVRFFPDPLPPRLRQEQGLPLRADAIVAAHRPRDRDEAEAASGASRSRSCSRSSSASRSAAGPWRRTRARPPSRARAT